MKAMLVLSSFMCRVIVPDDATDTQIMDAAEKRLLERLSEDNKEFHENVEEIYEDTECPYDPEVDG